MLSDELRYQLLRTIERNPELTQRQIAKELGLSLGKVNYCVKALLDKGWIKAGNFKNSSNKRAYAYILTPKGLEEKGSVTLRFLKRKLQEYEDIQYAIEQLQNEVTESQRKELKIL
ncbi:MarR family EPS-associated transcriptional regulator [Saccharospirillum alexandrii]|uniref:MarR family EPS-associated transcriptional regulator n=1 Tax=Saccharospirillum alexandrii TaxID=2448477 RepID=UPI000FDB46D4|nr:MarR family EPS-associated transcriptional regulator [Saccharospirillum alexandrii]